MYRHCLKFSVTEVGGYEQNWGVTRKMSENEVIRLFKKNSLIPLETYKNSQTPLKSKCLKCNNIIFPRLDKVTLRGHQCGYCAGRKGVDKKALALVKRIGHILVPLGI
jgi:hypothetical protein